MIQKNLLTMVSALSLGVAATLLNPASSRGMLGAQRPATLTVPKSGKADSKADSIPRQYLPPAGMCRVWIQNVPAAQQPAPTDCPTAIQKKPANGRVIYGEEKGKAKGLDKLPIKGFIKPPEGKKPPLIPPDIEPTDPRYARDQRQNKRISDAELFGDQPANQPASSYPGGPPSPQGPLGSYSGYVTPGGVVVGPGGLQDPRYFQNNPDVKPSGMGRRRVSIEMATAGVTMRGSGHRCVWTRTRTAGATICRRSRRRRIRRCCRPCVRRWTSSRADPARKS